MKKTPKFNLHIFDEAAAVGGVGAEMGDSQGIEANTQASQGTESANTQTEEPGVADVENEFNELKNGKYKEAYDKSVQKVINKRFKQSKELESQVKSTEPILNLLYDLHPEVQRGDYNALQSAIANDDRLYEEEARKNGVSIDTQREISTIKRENARYKADEEARNQEMENQRIVNEWYQQGEELKKDYPDFDLNASFEDENFVNKLVKNGLSVSEAYKLTHFDDIAKSLTEKTEKKVTDTIRAKGMRVNENGISSQATATVHKNINEMSDAEILALAKRAHRGEKIEL